MSLPLMSVKLRYWRKRRFLSIDDLAEKAQVSAKTIVNIEVHGIEPRPRTVRKLATALEIELDELNNTNNLEDITNNALSEQPAETDNTQKTT